MTTQPPTNDQKRIQTWGTVLLALLFILAVAILLYLGASYVNSHTLWGVPCNWIAAGVWFAALGILMLLRH